MPIIPSTYQSPRWLSGGHKQTVFPHFFRWVKGVKYRRERIDTPDDDFLDLDWASIGKKRLLIVSHGLEGDSHSTYVKGIVKGANKAGWDALAWNYRGCSGVPNRKIYAYHSGATHDLDTVFNHVLRHYDYKEVALVGFSLGGNLTLKYLGERGQYVHQKISKAVVFSTPTNLAASSRFIEKGFSKVYAQRFLVSLKEKVETKAKAFPRMDLDVNKLKHLKTLKDFDDHFTAPIHGFKDAEDYYTRCSSGQFIPHITIPTLIVNAQNDPFLPIDYFPVEMAQTHKKVYLEMPKDGGHVGFFSKTQNGLSWVEDRTFSFLENQKVKI